MYLKKKVIAKIQFEKDKKKKLTQKFNLKKIKKKKNESGLIRCNLNGRRNINAMCPRAHGVNITSPVEILTSPFRTIVPAYTQRQSTRQCCQYFDYTLLPRKYYIEGCTAKLILWPKN